jgi:rubrerythrin
MRTTVPGFAAPVLTSYAPRVRLDMPSVAGLLHRMGNCRAASRQKQNGNLVNGNQLNEALRSALRIEEESFVFYMEAAIRLPRPELVTLTQTLAERELEHVNRLRSILGDKPLGMEELGTELIKRRPRREWIVKSDPIPEDADERTVLTAAIKREDDTRRTYDLMATFTTYTRDFTGLCAYLAAEEAAHAATLRERLAALAT